MQLEDLIFYEIYPKSFCDSDGDGVGDLRGIIQKADYLQQLGINGVWIAPCFESPNADNGYDISNYRKIAPEMGSMQDMEMLIQALHQRDIIVILDLVANHTSTQHEWFLQSRKSKHNPYRHYYIWRKTPPNDWQSFFGGSAWEYDKTTDEYYLHSFAIEQADLNWENEKVREEIRAIVDFWVRKGVDGFRCDVLDMISKDWEKCKNGDGPKLHEYIRELFGRENVQDLFAVGECWTADENNAKLFCDRGRCELKTVFAFSHLCLEEGKFALKQPSLFEVCSRISDWQIAMQRQGLLPTVFLENHDQPRSVSRFIGEENLRFEGATFLGALTLLHRGIPFLYQGQEIGLTNNVGEKIEDFNDVEAINYYHENEGRIEEKERIARINYGGRDNARYMMPWRDEDTKSWALPYVHRKEINVKADKQAKKSVLDFYQKTIALRKKEKALREGEYKKVNLTSSHYVFERICGEERLRIVCNFENQTPYEEVNGEILLNNYETFDGVLQPFQVLVFKV